VGNVAEPDSQRFTRDAIGATEGRHCAMWRPFFRAGDWKLRYTYIHHPSGHILRHRTTFVGALFLRCFLKLRRLPPGYSQRLRKSGFGQGIQKGGTVTMVAINTPELWLATEPREHPHAEGM
jgi:hypothetical protein